MATSGISFGRYEVLSTLGLGGFATVYRARDTALGREVALKVLSSHLAEDSSIHQRFLTEARLLARLDHPNIVPVYDVGEANGQPFFAMRVIEGETLDRMLTRTGPIEFTLVVELMRSIGSSVDYLHTSGLVHRDIKAANVMVDRSGRVVLMDFGIARILDGTQYTNTGAVMGTPEAMAPEQALGEPAGPAADIYALGILTYKLLAGRAPFAGATPYVLRAHAYDHPPALEDIRPGLPPSAYQAIAAALSKPPDSRPACALLFAQNLAPSTPTLLDESVTKTIPIQSDQTTTAYETAATSLYQHYNSGKSSLPTADLPTVAKNGDVPAKRPTTIYAWHGYHQPCSCHCSRNCRCKRRSSYHA